MEYRMNLFNTLSKYLLFFLIVIPGITLANNQTLFSPRYSVGLDVGVAKPADLGNTTTFPIGFSTFSYNPNANDVYDLISGISLGKIIAITPVYSAQVGVSAHYLSDMNMTGNLSQGISPPFYQTEYAYNVDSFQYLLDAKLRRQFSHVVPYIYLGLGVASNRAYHYSTTVPAYLTVTPQYNNQTTNSFSYSLGFGIDYLIQPQLSIGLAYRFIDLGKVALGSGMIRNTAVGAQLSQSNAYVNALLAELNYFI